MEVPSYEVIKFKLLGTRFTFAVIDNNVTSSPKKYSGFIFTDYVFKGIRTYCQLKCLHIKKTCFSYKVEIFLAYIKFQIQLCCF